MSVSNMSVFDKQVQLVATETIDQNVQKFNEASAGALVIGSAEHIGDYLEEASYKLISGLARRRNARGNGSVASKSIRQDTDRSVKVDGGIGPVDWTMEQFRRLGKSQEEAGLIIGEQASAAMLKDYINTSVMAVRAAIERQTELVHDATAGKISLPALNRGASKFGDRSQSLACWMMHGTTWHDLIDEAIQNTNRLFNIGDINVMEDKLGRRYVVTDSPALMTAGSPDTYHTLGLVPGAVQVQTGALISVTKENTGGENITVTHQGEYNFMLGLLGYSWNSENGGASPSDAALASGASWDLFASSLKDTAGVLVKSQ